MAKQEIVTLVDDLDGSEAAETVSYGLDGRFYEIDLSTVNAARLRNALTEFNERARRVQRSGAVLAGRDHKGKLFQGMNVRPERREQLRRIRQWASDNGLKVSDRGRIPNEIEASYWIAQKGGNPFAPQDPMAQRTA